MQLGSKKCVTRILICCIVQCIGGTNSLKPWPHCFLILAVLFLNLGRTACNTVAPFSVHCSVCCEFTVGDGGTWKRSHSSHKLAWWIFGIFRQKSQLHHVPKINLKQGPEGSMIFSLTLLISGFKQKEINLGMNSECNNASLVYTDSLVTTQWVPGQPICLYFTEHYSVQCTVHCTVHCTIQYSVSTHQSALLTWLFP